MTETLMQAKFKDFNKYFESSKNRGMISEGWSKITYAINRDYSCTKTSDQIKARYQYLLRKWRGHQPNGKEFTKTGNDQPDDSKPQEEELAIIADYMSQKAGCGTDLGQASESAGSPDEDDLTSTPATGKRIVARTPKQSKHDVFSDLGSCVENGLNSVSNGLKAIASSLSSTSNNEVLELLREAKKSRIEDQSTLRDMRSFFTDQ